MEKTYRLLRAWHLVMPLLFILPSFVGPASGQTPSPEQVIIGFDLLPVQTVVADQYPGVHFSGLPQVIVVGEAWKNLGTISSTKALFKGSTGPLLIRFDAPQSYVKVHVGSPTVAGNKARIELRAYRVAGAARALIKSESIAFDNVTGITRPLEIRQILGCDIREVEVEYVQYGYTIIDGLEFGATPVPYRSTINFDDRPAGTEVVSYPGVTFPDGPEIYALGQAWSRSGSTVLSKDQGFETDPGPMILQFNPTQGAVRVHVGSPAYLLVRNIRVTMRAYVQSGATTYQEVARLERTFPDYAPLTTPMEIDRWTQRDIARVEIEYRGERNEVMWEMIDDLEFGPVNPSTGPDTAPPRVVVTNPTENQTIWQTSLGQTTHSLPVSGRIWENEGLISVAACAQLVGSSQIQTNLYTGGFTQSQITNWTFNGFATLRVGLNRVWVVATDTSRNPSAATPAIEVYYGLPQSAVTQVNPLTSERGYLLRQDDPGTTWDDRLVLQPSNRRITVLGRNLHERVEMWLESIDGGNTVLATGTVVERSADQQRLVFELSDQVLMNLEHSLWNLRLIDRWADLSRPLFDGRFAVQEPPYAKLWGFGFPNEGDQPTWGEFFGVFGSNAYVGWPFYARDPFYRLYYDEVYQPLLARGSGGSGTCVGMASSSLLLYHRRFDSTRFNPNTFYPNGFTFPGKPARYHFPSDAPGYWLNFWGWVRSNHGVQLSSELILHLLRQIRDLSTTSVGGNPVARLEELRAANPLDYIVSIVTLRGSGLSSLAGHAMIPYRVEGNRIYVHDNNWPFRNSDLGNPNNAPALDKYIEIDRVRNEYVYTGMNPPWRGSALYTMPISLWTRSHTMPGLGDVIRHGLYLLFGSADAEYSDPDTQQSWGWSSDGTFRDTLDGASAIVPMNSGPEGTRAVLLALDGNRPRLNVNANVRGSGGYQMFAAQGGRFLSLKVLDSAAGDREQLNVGTDGQAIDSIRYAPAKDGTRAVSSIGLVNESGAKSVFRWASLQLPAGGHVQFRAIPGLNGAEFVNQSGVPLNPLLLVSKLDGANGLSQMVYESIGVPANGVQRLTTPGWPHNRQLRVDLDANGDGTFEDSTNLTGRSAAITDNPDGHDQNGNGISDDVDTAFATSADQNRNGIPDEAEESGLSLQRYEQIFLASGGTTGVQLNAPPDFNWTVVNTNSWVNIFSETSGTGPSAVQFGVNGHSGPPRSATFLIAGMTFTIRQQGVEVPTASVDRTSQFIGASGGIFPVVVTATANFSWTVENQNSWVTILSGTGGTGSGMVRVSVDGNVDPPRTGTIVVAGATITIEQEGIVIPTVLITPTNQVIPANGATFWVAVATPSDFSWTTENTNSWINILEGGAGTGAGVLQLGVDGHLGGPRTGILTIAGQTLTVEQEGLVTPTVSIVPTNQPIFVNGGTFWIEVIAPADMTWMVDNPNPWITILQGGNGTGPGEVQLAVDSNFGAARLGTLTIAGLPFTVEQEGMDASDVSLSRTNQVIPANGAVFGVEVTAPADSSWTVENPNPWITILQGGNGTGPGLVQLAVDGHLGAPRTGTLTIAGITLTVEQEGILVTAPFITPTNQVVPAIGGTFWVDVIAPADLDWTAENQNPWITILQGSNGKGSGVVQLAVDAHLGAPRTGLLTIAGITLTVEQEGAIVVPSADLAVLQTASADSIAVGQEVTLTITVTNQGPNKATEVVLNNLLPAGVTVNAVETSGAWSQSNNLIECVWNDLLSGQIAVLVVRVTFNAEGSYTNQVTVVSSDDSQPSNNQSTIAVQVTALPEEDKDKDGMPGDWEKNYDLDDTNPNDAWGDLDNDRSINLHEFRAGTDPKDPASVLRIVNAVRRNDQVIIQFSTVLHKRYQLHVAQEIDDLAWSPVGDILVGTGAIMEVAVPNLATTQMVFCRIMLQP